MLSFAVGATSPFNADKAVLRHALHASTGDIGKRRGNRLTDDSAILVRKMF